MNIGVALLAILQAAVVGWIIGAMMPVELIVAAYILAGVYGWFSTSFILRHWG
jgi:hypothetical protein